MLDIDIDLKCFADNEKMARGCRQHKELLFSPCESPEREPYKSLIKYIPCIHMSGLAVWLAGWLVGWKLGKLERSAWHVSSVGRQRPGRNKIGIGIWTPQTLMRIKYA
jgi:hypothetical protein